jgi:hypothetical protein
VRLYRALAVMAAIMFGAAHPAASQSMLIEDFAMQPETRWRFFADTVMGGVSTGQMTFVTEDGRSHALMTGRVSTENNGGFIQIRLDLQAVPPKDAIGVRLLVRGNDARYFVHLRTFGTLLPWQYYQASFDVSRDWAEVKLPFKSFKASGRLLRSSPDPQSLESIGIVAFGRDHEAEIAVREVSFY